MTDQPSTVPRLEGLHVRNYRALHNLKLESLTPLTVFLGPNGSGKSTIVDLFAFLTESFSAGLRSAWDKRGRFRELRTRGAEGPISFELQYREKVGSPLMTYHLSLAENSRGPYIATEWLEWFADQENKRHRILDFQAGNGWLLSGDWPTEKNDRLTEKLAGPEVSAVNTLGQLTRHPRLTALRHFITDWFLVYLTTDNIRGLSEAGPQERLSPSGDNLPNVSQYLKEQHPQRWEFIRQQLASRIPQLEQFETEFLADGRLGLRLKETPFRQSVLAKYASEGTLKMLAYLTILHDPQPPSLITLEEPENHLHPRLLPELAEECLSATRHTQLLVTTHSPFFINGLRPAHSWVLYRNEHGFTQAIRTADIPGIPAFINEGALLGDLWVQGYFGVGDPLTTTGGLR